MSIKRIFLTSPLSSWQSETAYTLGQQIVYVDGYSYIQQVTLAGTSGASAPSFSTTTGGTTADGSVEWTCAGRSDDSSVWNWIVPDDWNNTNTVECIGAGACGYDYNTGTTTGAGGGAGAYAKITRLSLTSGASVSYSVGVTGTIFGSGAEASGKDTWFDGTTLAGSSVGAKAGLGPLDSATGAGGAGGAASESIGTVKYSGGNGGASAGPYFCGNGAGGGAAGPNGPGGNGGTANSAATLSGAGGGGGSNGASGGNSTVPPGFAGQGGNNPTSPGADGSSANGAGGPNGSPAGGGNGGTSDYGFGGNGGNGTEWDSGHGAGAGGGGGANFGDGGGVGGLYGGGGGGAGGGPGGGAGLGSAGLIVISYTPISPPPIPSVPGWLIINEPQTGSPPTGGGFTDRTNYLFLGDGHQNNYTVQMRQRGQATIHLIVKGNDTYAPTYGSPVFLYDQIGDDFVLNFSGLIQNIENQFFADSGDHFVLINVVSFESVLDTVLTTVPVQFFQMTCGEIVKELFNTFEAGAPISLGNIEDGATIELLNTNFDTISSLLDELATSSNFIWGVNPATLQLYFQPPYTTTAPFVLTSPPPNAVGFGAQFGTINWKQIGNDYRNRQAIRINSNAFSHSTNYYQGAGQLNFTLSNPAAQVVNAWITVSSPNYSVGTFTGNPSPGDTFTIEFPYGIPQTTWAPLTKYPIGAIIIDPGNFVQTVTVSSGSLESGATEPVWNEVTGGTTVDGGLIWTCEGPQGLGTGTAFTYTFVEASALDNTQFGQIVIGSSVAETVQNVQYALMAVTGDAVTYGEGINYSLPTWENGIVNTTVFSSTEFKCTSKTPGYSQGKCLFTTTSSVLSFNPTIAAGGSSPDEGLGNGQPGTITIAVGVEGTAIASPGLAYQPGSADVSLATPLDSGSNLQVEYTRADGDTIQVENTTLVNELALITHGTGKYQAIVDYSDQLVTITAPDALLQAQQILAAYSVVPQRVTFETYQPGLSFGQALTISVTLPTGAIAVINGVWVIEEIDAEIEPCELQGLCSGIGHYKYTVSCIDIQQIASYLDFWKQAGGGSSASGSGSGTALVSTGGGSTAVPGTAIELEVNGTDTTDQTILNLTAGPGIIIADEGSGEVLFSATGELPYSAGGGTANAQTATYTPAITSLTAGLSVLWLPSNANTSSTPTFSPNSLTAKTIVKTGGAALAANDLTTTAVAFAIYDGTNWELQNPQTSGGGGTVTAVTGSGAISSSGGATPNITVATASSSVFGVVEVDGTTITATAGVISAVSPYDVIFTYPGAPPNASLIYVICFPRAVTFPSNWTGSAGYCATNPTNTAVYTLRKNGTTIGAVTVLPSGVFLFTSAGGAGILGVIVVISEANIPSGGTYTEYSGLTFSTGSLTAIAGVLDTVLGAYYSTVAVNGILSAVPAPSFNSGDVLSVLTPATDATLANALFTLKGST